MPNDKNGKKKGQNGHFGNLLNEKKTKHQIIFVFFKYQKGKTWETKKKDAVAIGFLSLEREGVPSL